MTIGKYTIREIYFISESELLCNFENILNEKSGQYIGLVVNYDDFAKSKWLFNAVHYDKDGTVLGYTDYELDPNDEKMIKEYMIDYFNRNYDITPLLEK